MLAWLAVVGGWTLLLAGAAHLYRPGGLRSAVRSHGLLPTGVASLVSGVVPVVEVVTGVAVLWAAATGALWWPVATAGGGALTAVYGLYLAVLVRRGVAGDCGCGPVPDDVGRFTVARAAVLAVGLVGSAVAGPSGLAALVGVTGRALLLLSGFAGAVVGLTAHAGRAASERVMATWRHELAWQVLDEGDA
jgi:hypothetical protein